MKAAFEINKFMTENREMVISKYNELTEEKYFNGISLKGFMVQVLNLMIIQRCDSKKRAADLLPRIVGNIYCENSKVFATDKRTESLTNRYQGTSFMAII